MEQHEDNYLANRLAESLQISGGAGENHLLHNLADSAGGDLSAAPKSERDGDGDEDEEWKYIHEVQQTEKLQQQQEQHPLDAGNGFGQDDLIRGNGLGNGLAAAAAGLNLVYEEEDVEVIKHDGDLSTNSNTTTSTGEVLQHQEEQQQEQQQQLELEPEQQQQQLQQEDEDEPSSVATTYGTSSLSENNQEEPEQELAPQPAAAVQELLLEAFDNKENTEPAESHEESHSQLNPNAVAFVPNFGSQPSSPQPANTGEEPLLGLNPRQLLAPLDDLVAESPRKGSAREIMDTIVVPDQIEFDIEADKRPHELEQESDIFGASNLEQQLLNGAGNGAGNGESVDALDHGPETSVDLDLSLDQLPTIGDAAEDVMKQSIYAEHNASIEDILNSVQPLPEQTGDEKELLNVEEKEHVSQSPSTEELQFQQEFQQVRHQPPFFGGADEDPMQASFYLEHTSLEAQREQEPELEEQLQQPADTSDPFGEQSLLLDTSAPVFSPEAHEPVAKLELESQQADIVDITPSPLSSTEEKHLVEDTKELIEEPERVEIEAGLVKEQDLDLELESRQEPEQETHLFEPFSAGAPPQLEEYAAFNAAPGYEAQHDEDTSPAAAQGINPFAQPFTPAVKEETTAAQLEPETQAQAGNGFDELELQEELAEEDKYTAKPNFDSKYFDLGDKVQEQVAHEQLEQQQELQQEQQAHTDDFVPQEQQFSAPEEPELPPIGDFVLQEQQFVAPEEQLLPVANEFVEQEPVAPVEEPVLSQIEEPVLPTSEPVVEAVPAAPESQKEEEQATPVAEVAAVATAAAAAVAAVAVAATKSKDSKPSSPEGKKPASKTGVAAKPKPAGSTAAPSAIKKTTTSSTTTSKTATARPRTAPVAAASKPATSAPPTAATRKPLSSSAGTAAKPSAPRTTLSSTTRPATAPVSKPAAAAAKTTASKPAVSAARTSAAPRPVPSTTARKPATNGTGSGTASGASTARKPATSAPSSTRSAPTSAAAAPKPRVPSTLNTAAAAKPKVPSPRAASTSSTVRKVSSTNGAPLSARSPTKPTTNGLGSKSSSSTATTTTTTTTITKTFTARPAPKFTHSATNGSSSARRPLGATTGSSLTATTASASLRKASPSKASPLKTATTKPLTPKAKESATAAKPSPAGLKARKSTPLKGSTPTPIKAPVAAAPPAEPAAATNGAAKEEEAEVIKQNGNGLHDVEEAQEIQEQPPVPAGAAEVSLLDF